MVFDTRIIKSILSKIFSGDPTLTQFNMFSRELKKLLDKCFGTRRPLTENQFHALVAHYDVEPDEVEKLSFQEAYALIGTCMGLKNKKDPTEKQLSFCAWKKLPIPKTFGEARDTIAAFKAQEQAMQKARSRMDYY